MDLRSYQIKLSDKGTEILKNKKFVYYSIFFCIFVFIGVDA